MPVRFADTNVLLYLISTDPGEARKAEIARGILSDRELRLSVQVLQEFYVQATRATRPDALSHERAAQLVETFLRFAVHATTTDVLLAALATHVRYGISYWDATIIEAARCSGAEIVLSEDMGDGQDFGGVKVENPFAARSRSQPT